MKLPIQKKNPFYTMIDFIFKPENISNIIAIIVALILGYRSVVTGNTADYLQAVLVVLGILALGQLASGYASMKRDEEIKIMSQSVEKFLTNAMKSADIFFITRKAVPPIEMRTQNAIQLDMIGYSLVNLIRNEQVVINQILARGGKVRLIVSNPDNDYLQECIVMRVQEVKDKTRHANMVRDIIHDVKKISSDQSNIGSIEIRVTNDISAYSYVGIDSHLINGKINIEFYLTSIPLSQNPVFFLDQNLDPMWYRIFKEQFEIIWNQAQQV